jgi:hypothetical protein
VLSIWLISRNRYDRNERRIMDTPTQKIKKLIIDEGTSVTALAREAGCKREQMSMCINDLREYPELREFLERRFGQQLFGSKKKAREAA